MIEESKKKTVVKKTTRKEKPLDLKLVNLNNTKDGFLNLCRQYSHMGKVLKVHCKAASHPAFAKTDLRSTLQRLLNQYQEIGEQLKTIGLGLDEMGGDPMMYPEVPEPKLKRPIEDLPEEEDISKK